MKNNLFVFSNNNQEIDFLRFHICTWEFMDETALIEFGGEIKNVPSLNNNLNFNIYLPWSNEKIIINDLFESLVDSENCKLIFNEPVNGIKSVHNEDKSSGQIINFSNGKQICLFPIIAKVESSNIINISIDTKKFSELNNINNINIYFRFYIETSVKNLTIRKSGINTTSIIYDFQINVIRNKPKEIDINKYFCKIEKCYFINIIPTSYETTFYDNKNLKNIRTLEYDLFKKYINNKHIEKDTLEVVFNKDGANQSDLADKNYYFFIKYQKENIGSGQVFIAILINLVCQIIFFSFVNLSENSNFLFRSLLLSLLLSFCLMIYILIKNKIKNKINLLFHRSKK